MSSFKHENSSSRFYIVNKKKVGGDFINLRFQKEEDNENKEIYERLGRDLKDVIEVHVICFPLFHRK